MTDHGDVQIGALLAGRYRVERFIGQGGMGIVVQGMHLHLHQPVAMKFLLPEVLGNPQIVQRFLREAQAAVRLTSEHVARVIDVGSLETGAPYMVLEYLEGSDLSGFPRSQLTVGGVVDLVLQACEALAEAHSLGIVHRDIKPANFFITRRADGTLLLKVLDFGISKAPVTSSQLTTTHVVMGTPAYMSPEQMRSSRDVDHRSDIWSLGVVLYELLQGAPPFGGDSFSAMVLKVANDPVPKLTVRLPEGLDSVIYRCLEKDPAKRFQNIAELAHAVADYAQSKAQAAISRQRTQGIVGKELLRAMLDPALAQRALPSTISGSIGARTMPQGDSRRRSMIVVMAGTILIGGAVALVAARGGSDASSQPALVIRTGGPGMATTHIPPPTAVDAMPLPLSPTPADSKPEPVASASLDGGVIDTSLIPETTDAAVPPPTRPNTAGKAPTKRNMGADHARQTRVAPPPSIDRGD